MREFVTNWHRVVATAHWKVLDDLMSPYRPRTMKTGNRPHLSYLIRKPQPLGTEFKCAACTVTGCMLALECQEGKECMQLVSLLCLLLSFYFALTNFYHCHRKHTPRNGVQWWHAPSIFLRCHPWWGNMPQLTENDEKSSVVIVGSPTITPLSVCISMASIFLVRSNKVSQKSLKISLRGKWSFIAQDHGWCWSTPPTLVSQ